MQAELYSGSVKEIIDWCRSTETLTCYHAYVSNELHHVADAKFIAYLKKIQALSQRMCLEGYESVATSVSSLELLDNVLSDIFTVATYESWQYPASREGVYEMTTFPVCGLLGCGENMYTARLYVLDESRIALVRSCEASENIS